MQVMTRVLALFALILAALALPASADSADDLRRAMIEMRQGDYESALRTAGREGSIGRDVIEWHRLRAGRGTGGEVIAFLSRRPDWPGLDWLRRKSEGAIAATGQAEVLRFFTQSPPQSPEGVLAFANALIDTDARGDGEAALVLAWRTMPMGSAIQAAYLSAHKELLAPHHEARLSRMLWDGHLDSAGQMLNIVDDAHRKLAEARIALQQQAPGVDTKIAAVPASLQNDPGMAYDRFVWRDKKGRDADAIALMLERSSNAESLGDPGAWAYRRLNLARAMMRRGDPAQAYKIAASHHTTPEAGYVHADLEWLSGFLALRKLNNPKVALEHFRRFEAAVQSPISQGRGGYWLGRAHEALGEADAAKLAYAMGAQYQTSFYGLLAAERAGLPFDPSLRQPPELPDWRDLGEVHHIAAAHGRGITLLLEQTLQPVIAELAALDEDVADDDEELIDLYQEGEEDDTDHQAFADKPVKLAIIGRPNVGKSTLTNRILGEDRVIVYDMPGTTRDSIYIPMTRNDKEYILIDTAGVRKRKKVSDVVEKFSVIKTLQAIEDCNVVLLVVDARDGISDQDLSLLGFALNSGRSLVIAVNKWDGLDNYVKDRIKTELDRRLGFIDFARLHFISALHGTGVGHLFESVDEAYESATKRISTAMLRRIMDMAQADHQPPLVRGRRVKLKYAHAGGYNPPRIVIHGNQVHDLPDSYKRYLMNYYRKALKIMGTPIKIEFREGDNPFAGRTNKVTLSQKRKIRAFSKENRNKS